MSNSYVPFTLMDGYWFSELIADDGEFAFHVSTGSIRAVIISTCYKGIYSSGNFNGSKVCARYKSQLKPENLHRFVKCAIMEIRLSAFVELYQV